MAGKRSLLKGVILSHVTVVQHYFQIEENRKTIIF